MWSGKSVFLSAGTLLASLAIAGMAQEARQLTPEDYARAEKFMNYNVNPLVYHSVEHPSWLGDGRFWYRDHGPDGTTYTLVDPAKKTSVPAFDHAKLARALNTAMPSEPAQDPHHLAVEELSFADQDRTEIGRAHV